MIKDNTSRLLRVALFALAACVLGAGGAAAAERPSFSDAPTTNDGKKWRIGYYEGGPYLQYLQTLEATVRGLDSALGEGLGVLRFRAGGARQSDR